MEANSISTELTCDLLVIGSGAAGLTAAITAASGGLDVIVIEKSEYVGGATAWSGGWVWLPAAHSDGEDVNKTIEYLTNSLGGNADKLKIDTYARQASSLEKLLLKQTPVRFQKDITIPDYHINIAGYVAGGRSRVVAPIDGRSLGRDIDRLRKPMPVLTLAGLMPSAGPEMKHFFNATRSFRSGIYVMRRLFIHAINLHKARRNLTLTNGNALAGGLFKGALDLGVKVLTNASARSLTFEDNLVSGAVAETATGLIQIKANRGVVLACGGFPSSVSMRERFYKHAPTGREHWTVVPPECDGDGLRLGEKISARISTPDADAGAWVPVSMVPQPDGTETPFPHFADRPKPGLIAVQSDGKRFANEASPYFHFMKSLFDVTPKGEVPSAWLICDHRFQRRYGLGFSKPFPFAIGRNVSSGYLTAATTLRTLAQRCNIDEAAFIETVASYNANAAKGKDREFGRGSEPINRAQGDPSVSPNPCVRPILKPPFYAVKVLPGCLGSFAGIKTDEKARVLDEADQPIRGLYACGSDMASMMVGHYPAGGISLGPALVFGHIAGHSALSSNQKSMKPNNRGDIHANV